MEESRQGTSIICRQEGRFMPRVTADLEKDSAALGDSSVDNAIYSVVSGIRRQGRRGKICFGIGRQRKIAIQLSVFKWKNRNM
jgi:hypothetical protein